MGDEKIKGCECELCTNYNVYISKDLNLNKSLIRIVNNPFMNIKKKEITKEKLRILEKNENKNEGKEFENDGQQEKTKISLKKNKSKICAQNEENEEKEGVPYESEEINIGTRSDFKLEVDSSINYSFKSYYFNIKFTILKILNARNQRHLIKKK